MYKEIHKRDQSPIWSIRKYWKVMCLYERFEHIISLILCIVISVVIAVALWRLIEGTFSLLVAGAFNPLDHGVFQSVFGMIMTLLIAMEFNHSILRVVNRRDHIVQVKTVILISQLALARKFIILDFAETGPAKIAALGFAILALSLVYLILREREPDQCAPSPCDKI